MTITIQTKDSMVTLQVEVKGEEGSISTACKDVLVALVYNRSETVVYKVRTYTRDYKE